MPETTLYPPPRPLSVGEVLDLSFRIYHRTFVKCLVFGGLAVVANWLPNLYAIARGQTALQSVVRPVTDWGHVVTMLMRDENRSCTADSSLDLIWTWRWQ